MQHTKHLWRAALLIIAFATAGGGVRHFVVPESFGEQGFYRYNSLADYMAKPVVHGDASSCVACHTEIAETKSLGKHAAVSCEVCHAPLATHAVGAEKTGDMAINTSPDLCADCHQQLPARPSTMPQVDIREHLATLEVLSGNDSIPDGACLVCHDVHNPGLE